MTDRLPKYALSIRQPWAWAIVHGGKDIENRSWTRRVPGYSFRGEFCIHAAKGMTRDEYEYASDSIIKNGGAPPAAKDLLRGGIIGVGRVVDLAKESNSPWFQGPWPGLVGLVLADVKPIKFIPSVGALGFFKWQEADPSIVPAPAKWMQTELDRQIEIKQAIEPAPIPLFEEIAQ